MVSKIYISILSNMAIFSASVFKFLGEYLGMNPENPEISSNTCATWIPFQVSHEKNLPTFHWILDG